MPTPKTEPDFSFRFCGLNQDGLAEMFTLEIDRLSDDDRTILNGYWNGIGRFIDTNDSSQLRRFEGIFVHGIELCTDEEQILELEYESAPDTSCTTDKCTCYGEEQLWAMRN